MKVLWTANLIPANVSAKLALPSEVLGGWVESMAKQLNNINGFENAPEIGNYEDDILMMMYDDVVIKHKLELVNCDFKIL